LENRCQKCDTKHCDKSNSVSRNNNFRDIRDDKPSYHDDRKDSGSKKLTCYSCGEVGHYLMDPSCPKDGQKKNSSAKMFTVRDVAQSQFWDLRNGAELTPSTNSGKLTPEDGNTVSESGEERIATAYSDNDPSSEMPDGSQYSSEGELYSHSDSGSKPSDLQPFECMYMLQELALNNVSEVPGLFSDSESEISDKDSEEHCD